MSILLLLASFSTAIAQSDASTRSGRPDLSKEDLPTGIKETLAKARLKTEEKEYGELLERAEQAAKLGEELKLVFEKNQRLDSEDFKKIESLEKLVKRIRRDLGGKSDSEKADNYQMPSLRNAFSEIQNIALDLSQELKKSTRYTVSVKAVENSNELLMLMQYIKSNSRNL